MSGLLYIYTFYVRPDRGRFSDTVLEHWHMISGHQASLELAFTEPQFSRFREDLADDGFGLFEVTRVPYCEPEVVG